MYIVCVLAVLFLQEFEIIRGTHLLLHKKLFDLMFKNQI